MLRFHTTQANASISARTRKRKNCDPCACAYACVASENQALVPYTRAYSIILGMYPFSLGRTLWAFSSYKNFWKISIGNFRLGRARSICHKFHSRNPGRLKDRERSGTSDKNKKDEKSVLKWHTNFPLGSFHLENGTTFSEIPFIPDNFQWNEPKSRVPFKSQPQFPEFFGKWKTSFLTFGATFFAGATFFCRREFFFFWREFL